LSFATHRQRPKIDVRVNAITHNMARLSSRLSSPSVKTTVLFQRAKKRKYKRFSSILTVHRFSPILTGNTCQVCCRTTMMARRCNDEKVSIYLAAFFFFFFFFLASPSSSSGGGAASSTGGGASSFFSSSLTATNRLTMSFDLIM